MTKSFHACSKEFCVPCVGNPGKNHLTKPAYETCPDCQLWESKKKQVDAMTAEAENASRRGFESSACGNRMSGLLRSGNLAPADSMRKLRESGVDCSGQCGSVCGSHDGVEPGDNEPVAPADAYEKFASCFGCGS